MMLTLGQAAKEVGLSKTAISNAIKKGRLSAKRKESGAYEIDPAELFRVYPPKGSSNGQELMNVDPVKSQVSGVNKEMLEEKVDGLTNLISEKDKQIERLIRENEKTEELLDTQIEQSKRITLLLENKSNSGVGEWEKVTKALEARLANQEKAEKDREEREEKILRQNKLLRNALKEERSRGFFKKLFG
ncbi:MAG: hypothetical protein GY941_22715 [Planctomycetes bacterium]|nr:hypothetical protein [Planctomycetota bacterium]